MTLVHRINLTIPVSPNFGYGVDGMSLSQALLKWGLDVRLNPTVVGVPLPKDVAMLLTKPLEAPFLATIVHLDPGSIKAPPTPDYGMKIGWTMWEWTSLDNLEERYKETLTQRLDEFDVLVAYDRVTKQALESVTSVPVIVQQGGFDSREFEPVQRDWNSTPFRFCMVGVLNSRKAPFVAIEAFKELKDEGKLPGAELHLKTTAPTLHPGLEEWCEGIRVHAEYWSREQLKAFYASCHVLLAPSRGEGKNLPALEFQSTGGPVIATRFGGHAEWMGSWSYSVDYDLEADTQRWPNCLSAWASKDHMKDLMLQAFTARHETRQKGELAARTIPSMCSWSSVLERLFTKLADVSPEGARLRDYAMAVRIEEK